MAITQDSKRGQEFSWSLFILSRFVSNIAAIARPLYKISDKRAVFQWSEECQQAFNTLNSALISSPILSYPVPGCDFILDTDASDTATGTVLSQVQDGKEVKIAYFSKSINVHEKSYCVTRKEMLAVVNSLKAFQSYLYGQPVLLRTDNAAFRWMRNLKKPTGQTARNWAHMILPSHTDQVHVLNIEMLLHCHEFYAHAALSNSPAIMKLRKKVTTMNVIHMTISSSDYTTTA